MAHDHVEHGIIRDTGAVLLRVDLPPAEMSVAICNAFAFWPVAELSLALAVRVHRCAALLLNSPPPNLQPAAPLRLTSCEDFPALNHILSQRLAKM